jgi:hypothetical protein
MNDDRDLREVFAAWRRRDAARAPDFEAVLRRARTVPRARAWQPAALACLALGAMTVVLWRLAPEPAPTGRPASTLSLTDWRSSTDFLLATPGSELLHAVPRIGESHDPLIPHGNATENHS